MRFGKLIFGRQSVGVAALAISVAYLASRLLGLVRDRLIAANFGVSHVVDAYVAAFTLPDLLFTLLITGAFAVAFIPVASEYLEKDERDEVWRIASALLVVLALATGILSLVAAFFTEPLMRHVFARGFDEERLQLTIDLTRILLATPALFAISSVLGSLQQSFNRFSVFALSSVVYNLGIITGIMLLAPHLGIYGVAYGAVIGAASQALLQVAGLRGLGFSFKPSLGFRRPGVRKVIRLMIPRGLDQAAGQLNYVIEKIVGTYLGFGALTAFYFADNLKNVPMALLGSAVATAAFPRMAATAARGERQNLIEAYVTTARFILFLAIPAAIIAVLLRGYIVRLLFGFGHAETANALGWLSFAIVFGSLYVLVSRVYYAMQDSRTPLMVSLSSIVLNIPLSAFLASRFGVSGLAAAASFVVGYQTLSLLVILRQRQGNFGERTIIRGLGPMLVSATIMASTLYIFVSRLLPLYATDTGIFVVGPKFAVLMMVAALAYFVPSYLMQLQEAKVLARRGRLMLRRFVPVA